MIQLLSRSTLGKLPPAIRRPAYDVGTISTGIVHLGIGAFHRAHQAVIFDDILARGDTRWGIIGASLRSADVRDRMAPQDNLYTLEERDNHGRRMRVVGAVCGVVAASEAPDRLINAMASAKTNIVTLTITEKGYLPAAGNDGAADYIVAALALRRERGLMPFTTISCDNLSGNGRVTENRVRTIAQATDPALHDWIAKQAAFPDTMVDRIVPATDDTDIARLSAVLGYEDRAMVKTEPYWQWVIENRFCNQRPDFETVGVQIVSDVAPYEVAKLRLLNGAHSALAYLGGLAGHQFVHQAFADPAFATFIERLWSESRTTLGPAASFDTRAYCGKLEARFANATLEHRLTQIAIDGSQKLPPRLIEPVRIRLERGQSIDALALAIASWMRWQLGRTEGGVAFKVDDPLSDKTALLLSSASEAADMVGALLTIEEIFGDLATNDGFRSSLTNWMAVLLETGSEHAAHMLTDKYTTEL